MNKILDTISEIVWREEELDIRLLELDPFKASSLKRITFEHTDYSIIDPFSCVSKIQFFDKYKLKKLLGKGAAGAIYEACDGSDCNNAIKLLLGRTDIKNLEEIHIVKKLNENANFDGIKLKYYDQCGNQKLNFVAIVFDKWEGDIQYEKFSTNEKEKMLKQIANQIKILHELGYVHNDLFKRNILYRRKDGEVEFTISDFGIAFKKSMDHDKLAKKAYDLNWRAYDYFNAPDKLGLTKNLENMLYSNLNLFDYLLLYMFIEETYYNNSLSLQDNRKINNEKFYDLLEKTFNYDTTRLRQLNPYK